MSWWSRRLTRRDLVSLGSTGALGLGIVWSSMLALGETPVSLLLCTIGAAMAGGASGALFSKAGVW